MKSGSRSVNTLREQLGLRQKNFRTVNNNRMGRPTQGNLWGVCGKNYEWQTKTSNTAGRVNWSGVRSHAQELLLLSRSPR